MLLLLGNLHNNWGCFPFPAYRQVGNTIAVPLLSQVSHDNNAAPTHLHIYQEIRHKIRQMMLFLQLIQSMTVWQFFVYDHNKAICHKVTDLILNFFLIFVWSWSCQPPNFIASQPFGLLRCACMNYITTTVIIDSRGIWIQRGIRVSATILFKIVFWNLLVSNESLHLEFYIVQIDLSKILL